MRATRSVLFTLFSTTGGARLTTRPARVRPLILALADNTNYRSFSAKMELANGLQDATPARNHAYERAKQTARAAAHREEHALNEWAVTKRDTVRGVGFRTVHVKKNRLHIAHYR